MLMLLHERISSMLTLELFYLLKLGWEFIKEKKKTRKKENTYASTQTRTKTRKHARKHALVQESVHAKKDSPKKKQ